MLIRLMIASFALVSCVHTNETSSRMSLIGTWELIKPPSASPDGKSKVLLGGFSGLDVATQANAPGSLVSLVSVSDRGPNLDNYKLPGNSQAQRPFLIPNYVPEILLSTWSATAGWNLTKRLPLSWPDGKPASGMPNTKEDENPVDVHHKNLALSARGLDPEGIALARDGHYWIVEEYGPSILKVDAKGRILKRYIPYGTAPGRYGTEALPAEFATRAVNRGFEGVTLVGDLLYAFLQSPLNGDHDNVKVLVWDTKRESVKGVIEYPLHHKDSNKIGDASALPDGRILVLEQDGQTNAQALRKVFVWNPTKQTKALVLDLTLAGYYSHEKIEGLSMISKTQLAVVADNDYGAKAEVKSELAVFEVAIP